MAQELLAIPEVRRILKMCSSKIYQLLHEGTLTRVKLGRRTFIARSDVDRFIGDLHKLSPEDWAEVSKYLPVPK